MGFITLFHIFEGKEKEKEVNLGIVGYVVLRVTSAHVDHHRQDDTSLFMPLS